MVSKISQHILQNAVICPQKTFSSVSELDAFFATIPSDAAKSWPFDFSKYGLETRYLSALVTPETWKNEASCVVSAEVYNNKNKAIIQQTFRIGMNDNLIINLDSVYADGSKTYPQGMHIARRISENNLNFMVRYDKKVKPSKPSFLRLRASSEMTAQNIKTCGGYVWANNGFDFSSKEELITARLAFKKFLFRYHINISDKKLKLFTKPCHFSAYSSGVFVSLNGKKYRMGKAFMLQHSWQGVMKSSSPGSVENNFATAYYSEPIPALRRRVALLELSRSYRSFLRDTKKKLLLSEISSRFKTLQRTLFLQNLQKRLLNFHSPIHL